MLERFVGTFDQGRFWADITQAINRQPPNLEEPIRHAMREAGLRFIVQAKRVLSQDSILGKVREAWGPPPEGVTLSVVRLFQADGEEATPEHLAVFNLITIADVDVNELVLSPYDACYALMLQSEIASVEPDLPFLGFIVTDALAGAPPATPPPADKAWALRNMRVDAAWRLIPSGKGKAFGEGVRIAHLDTGWTNHDDLDANFASSGIEDLLNPLGDGSDPMTALPGFHPGHGTRTGSVMISKGGMSLHDTTGPGEITGVAPHATYVPKRCVKSVIIVFAGDIAQAVRNSTRTDCHVISMSLGGRPAKALEIAVQDAVANNVLVVAAAGNSLPSRMVVWPAAYPECIALAATNDRDAPWSKSSRGKKVDVSAPGHDVWVAEPTAAPSGINFGSGTSYATAHTAGVAALWLAFHDRGTLIGSLSSGVYLQEVFRTHVKSTARVPGGWDSKNYGSGIIDAKLLLDSQPSAAVPLGLGQAKRPYMWWLETYRWRELARRLRDDPDEEDRADDFKHELQNLELDEDIWDAGGSDFQQEYPRMSRTLRQWLWD